MKPDTVPEAVVLWTGWGKARTPQRNDALVLERFGAGLGAQLLKELQALEVDFYRSDAHLTAPNLVAMGDRAAAEFRARHPHLPAEVADAFAWCYTFDYK